MGRWSQSTSICLRFALARHNSLAIAAGLIAAAPSAETPSQEVVVAPEQRAETEPVPSSGDAAADPALPQKSLILGVNKRGGLHVYDMSGTRT